jgi:hypothetical protein
MRGTVKQGNMFHPMAAKILPDNAADGNHYLPTLAELSVAGRPSIGQGTIPAQSLCNRR